MRVVLFTGKGGVGKTTTAAATAVHAARCGVKTLVVSADPAHSLADALGVRLEARPTEVSAGLFGQQVDPRARSERSWREIQEYLVVALDELGVDPLAADELTELPGADEVFSLLEVRDQVRHGPWGLVVVDCAPSAETLRLLAVPEVLTRYVRRLLPMERRIARIVGVTRRPGWSRAGGTGGVGGTGLPLPGDGVVEAAERFAAELAGVQEVLRSPATSVRLVLTAESVVLAETRRTWTALAMHGFAVDAVVANRLFDAESADPWQQGWARTQAQVLTEAEMSFAPVPVQRAGYTAAEPVGFAALAALGESLYGPAVPEAATALLEPPSLPDPFVVERETAGFVLRLALPLADRKDLDLGRRGDDLVVTVEGRRRVLALPSALRRCQVDSAQLRDGVLAVRFVPDPDQWRPM
ncbi:MAG TPA: ArsA family ATPase [Kineosporiaceae bacterium]|nr:ArsA family ATPase [Kineosporiaceae bacterium]